MQLRRTRLRDVLNVVTLKNELILLCLRLCDGNTIKHVDMPHDLCACMSRESRPSQRATHLLPQEVTNLKAFPAILNNAVDREVGVHRTHLVLEALKSG